MSVASSQWEVLCSYSDEFTCYSAAVATWAAAGNRDWRQRVSTGLWLRITEAGDGLFGFAYFPPTRRAELGLVRAGVDQPEVARDGVLAEIERNGRVIVAGDGFHLPWHVAHGRVHAPHWFVLARSGDRLEVADPFACRNELGVQEVTRQPIEDGQLEELLRALPGDDPVHALREVLALGDESRDACDHRHQWFVEADAGQSRAPVGLDGPDAIRRLARHFHEQGAEAEAYSQADDIWSIARHRAFMCRYTRERAQEQGDDQLGAWVNEHAVPLARKWGHIAPLLMQATLSVRAGRAPSGSVPATLEQLAELEHAAAVASEQHSLTIIGE